MLNEVKESLAKEVKDSLSKTFKFIFFPKEL